MTKLTVKNIAIKGVASCVPRKAEENATNTLFIDKEADNFSQSTGVYRRRIADEKTTTADLCYHAAQKLMAELKWDNASVECLIFVTQTPDYKLPATSCILQDRLGLSTEVYAIDISLGCSGWVYGLATIAQIMSSSGMQRGLLLVGDTISKICSKKDKSTYPLFGDAGTATAIEYTINESIKLHTATDGSGNQAIIIPDGGCRNPYTMNSLQQRGEEDTLTRSNMDLLLNGMDVFSFGITRAPQSVNTLLEYAERNRETVDYYLFHQANKFMNEKIRKKLKLTPEQIPYSLEDFGNTSSATIPLTMTTQIREQLEKEELTMIACGFGVGLSWGSVLFKTKNIVCPELIEI